MASFAHPFFIAHCGNFKLWTWWTGYGKKKSNRRGLKIRNTGGIVKNQQFDVNITDLVLFCRTRS